MNILPNVATGWGFHFKDFLVKLSQIRFWGGDKNFSGTCIFGSDRRQEMIMSVHLSVCLSVCPGQTWLEQSIFINLAQIFKQSVRNKSAVSVHSESTQWALRGHAEHQNKSQFSWSLKYFVLLVLFSIKMICQHLLPPRTRYLHKFLRFWAKNFQNNGFWQKVLQNKVSQIRIYKTPLE